MASMILLVGAVLLSADQICDGGAGCGICNRCRGWCEVLYARNALRGAGRGVQRLLHEDVRIGQALELRIRGVVREGNVLGGPLELDAESRGRREARARCLSCADGRWSGRLRDDDGRSGEVADGRAEVAQDHPCDLHGVVCQLPVPGPPAQADAGGRIRGLYAGRQPYGGQLLDGMRSREGRAA